jgi:3-hydroxybutyryl-CoA dehydratase
MNNKMTKIEFDTIITNENRITFAELSGDWNPLHTDPVYAESTEYKTCILHGAFSAGLFSRMAGMIYPGESCLLHSMQLKFIKPIITPLEVRVIGEVTRDNGTFGEVFCRIENKKNGLLLVEGAYQFGRRENYPINQVNNKLIRDESLKVDEFKNKTIITGASGAIGAALLESLGDNSIPLKYSDLLNLDEEELINKINLQVGALSNIVHCGWPEPNNLKLTELSDLRLSIQDQVSSPLEQIIRLARLIKKYGKSGGCFILIGSSYSNPGSHGWRFPLYSLSKGMLLNLTKILAQELSSNNIKVIGVSLDVIDGGMNKSITNVAKQIHADRTLNGVLPSVSQVVKEIEWLFDNPGNLISGSFIDLTGGTRP